MSKFEEHPAVAVAVACKYCSLVLTGALISSYNRNVPFHNGKWILYPIFKPHEAKDANAVCINFIYVYDPSSILLEIMKFKILLLASIILTFLHTWLRLPCMQFRAVLCNYSTCTMHVFREIANPS